METGYWNFQAALLQGRFFIAYQPPADLHESGIAGQQIKTDHVALKAQSLDLWYQPASENRQSPFRLALQEKTLSTKDSTK